MDKGLKKLEKALHNLGYCAEWGEFGDGSGEWVELVITKEDTRVQVVFHTKESGDGVSVYKEHKKWDEDGSKQVI